MKEALDWAFGVPGRIQQYRDELVEFLKRVTDELRPERTVELGSWRGANAMLLSMVTSKVTVSLDIEDYGGREEMCRMARDHGRTLWFYLESARDPKTVEHVMKVLEGPIDLLFIDDGHCIEEVTEEYQLWTPMVKKGGWIAFHDINQDANQCAPGVHPSICQAHAFWAGLKGKKEEIISIGIPPGPGIGILKV
jgi:predicted O-methyltransferase YrrM